MRVTRHNKAAEKTSKGRWPQGYFSQAKAAHSLGVSRIHLNKVLRGKRISHSLIRRYNDLLAEKGMR